MVKGCFFKDKFSTFRKGEMTVVDIGKIFCNISINGTIGRMNVFTAHFPSMEFK